MMSDVKINVYQFLVLVTFFTIGTSILIVPAGLAADANQDAWIVAILGMVVGLLVVWLFTTIAFLFPHLTYIQINKKIFGKWVGIVVSLLFISMSFLYTAILLSYSGTFLNTQIMPGTPLVALNFLMAFIMVMGVRLGLETIARIGEILILVFFVIFLILVVFIIPEIKFENIQPVFEVGPKKIIHSTLFITAVSSANAIILLMIFPAFINKMKHAKKSFFIGNIIGGIALVIITFLCISVLGAEKTARELYPGYELAKRINIGDFVQRIEALMATLWIISLYFKTVLYFYASVLGIAQLLKMKDYRPMTIPLGLITISLSLSMFPNVIYQQIWGSTTAVSFSLLIGVLFPLLLLIVYLFRKKHLKGQA